MYARRLRVVRNRILFLGVILFLIYTGSIQTFIHARRQHGISTKNLPTELSSLDPGDQLLKKQIPRDGVLRFRASRYIDCVTLGHGKEGHTSVCTDMYPSTGTGTGKQEKVVVKRYYNDADILRNEVPFWLQVQITGGGDPATPSWPVEIPASILLDSVHAAQDEEAAFVPIQDFFLDTECCLRPRWHSVSAFFERGSLETFAERIRTASTTSHPTSANELDEIYRAHFETLLSSLAALHAKGLCHDDVKPSNVFVSENPNGGSVRFILGDFGQLREQTHPYHESRKWCVHGRQWADCRLNDARRAIKTYLSFLRAASTRPDDFDDAFFLGREGWSYLYWSFLQSPVHAEELITISRETRDISSSSQIAAGKPPGYIPLRLFASDRDVLRAAVSQELACKLLWVGESRLSDFMFAGWEIEQPVSVPVHSEELKTIA